MPEQESSPELQAAREDAIKRYREATIAVGAAKSTTRFQESATPDEMNRLKDEADRLSDECRKLGISDDELDKAWGAALEATVNPNK